MNMVCTVLHFRDKIRARLEQMPTESLRLRTVTGTGTLFLSVLGITLRIRI